MRLGGQQHADARRHPAEDGRLGLLASEDEQGVLDEWVIDEVDGHGAHYTRWHAARTTRLRLAGHRPRPRGFHVNSR